MLHKKTEEDFTKEALNLLNEEFNNQGVCFINKRIYVFKKAVLSIGELYYKLKKREEL